MCSCASSPDQIVVRDGVGHGAPVIKLFCNTVNSQQVLSSYTHLTVNLRSDHKKQKRGFAAVYFFIQHAENTNTYIEQRSAYPSLPHTAPAEHPYTVVQTGNMKHISKYVFLDAFQVKFIYDNLSFK